MDITVPGNELIVYLLAAIRISAWLVVVPPFSSRSIPSMAKVAIAIGLAFTVAPAATSTSVPTGTTELAMSILTQVAVGLAMGFLTSLLFQAIAAAGSLIDTFGGFSMVQMFDPSNMTTNTVFGRVHSMLTTMLLFATGGHLLIIGGLLKSFDLLPVGETTSLPGGTTVLVTAFRVFVVTTVQIALPMVAILFVADLSLALMTKVAPTLNAMTIMFPVKIGLTLLLIGLSFPALPGVMERLTDLANQASSTLLGG